MPLAPPSGVPPLDEKVPGGAVKRQAVAPAPVKVPAKVSERATLRGWIEVAPKLLPRVTPGMVIFLVVRRLDNGKASGLLAAKRLVAGNWPLEFVFDGTGADMHGAALPSEGEVEIMARVDHDGDAMTHAAGDLMGVMRTRLPNAKLRLLIDQVEGEMGSR